MAVQIKKKALTIVSLVKRLFPAEQVEGDLMWMATQLEAKGFVLKTTPSKFYIEVDSGQEMTYVSQVDLKLEAVTLAMKGKLGHVSKVTIRDKVIDLIKEAHTTMQAHYGGLPPAVEEKVWFSPDHPDVYDAFSAAWSGGNKVKAIKDVRTMTGIGLKEAKDLVEKWIKEQDEAAGEFPIANPDLVAPQTDPDFDIGTPVSLLEASMLHQPVHGTSSGSVYHVIALGEEAIVAARIQNNHHIALRVEPVNGAAIGGKLKAAGMKKASSGTHYSVHLEPDSLVMAKKCIGSVLFATGIPFGSISSDIESLVGAGK